MRANLKVLLVIELFVCFAPATLLLFFGLLFLPVSFVINPQLGNLDALAMVVGGLCGIVGIVVVVAALLSDKRPRLSTATILVLAALGVASLLPLVVGSVDSLSWRLLGLLPILAGAHVIYLARSLLFKSRVAPSGRHDDV
jgi:hypothetical protein